MLIYLQRKKETKALQQLQLPPTFRAIPFNHRFDFFQRQARRMKDRGIKRVRVEIEERRDQKGGRLADGRRLIVLLVAQGDGGLYPLRNPLTRVTWQGRNARTFPSPLANPKHRLCNSHLLRDGQLVVSRLDHIFGFDDRIRFDTRVKI